MTRTVARALSTTLLLCGRCRLQHTPVLRWYITRLTVVTHTHTHTRARARTHTHTHTCRGYLSHDAARSTAYRWGEDGLLGFTDRECRLCFALALWNGKDPILKERLFGLTGDEGNHGEDVKEIYHYLESTPTHSVCKMRCGCCTFH
jgi:hypothetical protein